MLRDDVDLTPFAWACAVEGQPTPQLRSVDAADIPQPARDLLVHENDMTSTLEAFAGQRLSLRVLHKRVDGDRLLREVVLYGDDDGRAVEYGAIRIHLGCIVEDEVRRQIEAGTRPLGGILKAHGIEHRCQPTSFIGLDADDVSRRALGFDGDHVLYGRHTLLHGPNERPLAEVTEILPPL